MGPCKRNCTLVLRAVEIQPLEEGSLLRCLEYGVWSHGKIPSLVVMYIQDKGDKSSRYVRGVVVM